MAFDGRHIRLELTYAPCGEFTGLGKDSELLPMVKTENSHAVDGPFGGEFSWIYNHVAELWQPEVARRRKNQCFAFFWIPSRKIFQIPVPKRFITTLMDVLCSNFMKFG